MAGNDFERAYYESDTFWVGEMVQDAANQKRIQLTAEYVKPDVQSVIDVGCGNGVFLKYLNRVSPHLHLVGVDRSETALRYVDVQKIEANIDKIPVDDHSFDCVTCLEVLEHLPVNIYERSLDELARISKKYLIVSVPYKEILEHSYTKCPNCKTIFNRELHLRSYDENNLRNLFVERGFECVGSITTGTASHYKGHRKFVEIFYPEALQAWKSPICPICGYTGNIKQSTPLQNDLNHSSPGKKRKLISYLTFLPKLFWPKERKDYWIIALFRRTGQL